MYKQGSAFEYSVARKLRDKGYLVFRSAGSHGSADLIALPVRNGLKYILLVQCKHSNSNNLNIRTVLKGDDVYALTQLRLDSALQPMVKYVVMIKTKRSKHIVQLVWSEPQDRWRVVTII